MVVYVHIEVFTYQFSKNRRGGGIHPPAPGPYGKKRGPERVKEIPGIPGGPKGAPWNPNPLESGKLGTFKGVFKGILWIGIYEL